MQTSSLVYHASVAGYGRECTSYVTKMMRKHFIVTCHDVKKRSSLQLCGNRRGAGVYLCWRTLATGYSPGVGEGRPACSELFSEQIPARFCCGHTCGKCVVCVWEGVTGVLVSGGWEGFVCFLAMACVWSAL